MYDFVDIQDAERPFGHTFSAIWNPIGIPFGTKLLLGPNGF